MSRPVTIVMYHYVRELEHSRFRDIKGLTVQRFQGQLDYMQRHYTFITVDQLIASLEGKGEELPRNAAMLTFDDGYIDHFTNVFPLLNEKGIQGCFFPVGKAVAEHRMLNVNKIHLVLASVEHKTRLVREIFSIMDELRSEFALESNEYYYEAHAHASRFDTAEVIFIKRLLQMELPEATRIEITDRLFLRHVGEDEEAFAREMYMSSDQLKCMQRAGMYISSHSYEHRWMDAISPKIQQEEIDSSLKFLEGLGCDLQNWSFNYPYGMHDESLISLLHARACRFGLTTAVGIADLDDEGPLALSRLDTNDLPQDGNAEPNLWTSKVVG